MRCRLVACRDIWTDTFESQICCRRAIRDTRFCSPRSKRCKEPYRVRARCRWTWSLPAFRCCSSRIDIWWVAPFAVGQERASHFQLIVGNCWNRRMNGKIGRFYSHFLVRCSSCSPCSWCHAGRPFRFLDDKTKSNCAVRWRNCFWFHSWTRAQRPSCRFYPGRVSINWTKWSSIARSAFLGRPLRRLRINANIIRWQMPVIELQKWYKLMFVPSCEAQNAPLSCRNFIAAFMTGVFSTSSRNSFSSCRSTGDTYSLTVESTS